MSAGEHDGVKYTYFLGFGSFCAEDLMTFGVEVLY